MIDTVSSGLVVSTDASWPIASGSISIDNPPVINGETDSYLVTITPSTALIVGDRISIVFPSVTTVSSTATCSAVLGFSSVSCSISGNNVTMTILALTGANLTTNGQFWISAIKNSYYIDPILGVTSLTITDSLMWALNDYPSSATNMLVATTAPAALLNPVLTQASLSANTQTTYKIDF